LPTSAPPATHSATECTWGTDSGFSSFTTADQTMPTPTASSSKPNTKDAAVSNRWCP